MMAFLQSGHAVDLVLAVIVAEFAALIVWPGARPRSRVALDAFFALAPGACLLMALRGALTGAGWTWIAFWLAASFPLHLIDLMRRMRS